MNWQEALHSFHFLRPMWLLALPVCWALVLWLARRRAHDGKWSRLIDPELLQGLTLPSSGNAATAVWPWLLCVWTLAIVALAGPSWTQDQTRAYHAPAAWMVALDLSPSMTATDVAPNRFTRARFALNDVLDGAQDARVGLVVFSDEAFTVSPLTDDAATIRGLLSPLAPDIMPSAGDNLAPALDRAGKLLEQSGTGSKQLILLSDGFSDAATALQSAARLKAQGITLNVVGIGTLGGAPLLGTNGTFQKDAKGQPQLARLDQDRLRHIASAGGGRYFDLKELPALITELNSHTDRMANATSEQGVVLAHWLDGGIWLLPGLLLLAAFLARRELL